MADTQAQPPNSTLFVGGLPPQATPSTLHAAFIPFGEISDISLPKPEAPSRANAHLHIADGNHIPSAHRGYGYISFTLPADSADAMDNMDQSEFFGRVIKVAPAKPSQVNKLGSESEGVLGSKTAVWEQEGWLAANTLDGGAQINDVAMEGPADGLEGLDVAGPRGA